MPDLPELRIGQGFDVHALVPERALILGGVTIPHQLGLLGHSDADVLIHAICDALLGAMGWGDIGHHFPDTDPTHAGMDSRQMLRQIYTRIDAAGYTLNNLDATLIAQAPRLAPHLATMVTNLSADLHSLPTRINLKATTTERLGFTGRGEGIAAQAICLLRRSPAFPIPDTLTQREELPFR